MFIFRCFLGNQTECREKWQISWVVSIAKEVEKTLLDFENVGRVCLDCKSKLHLNSKQRTGKMDFLDWWGKTKTKNKNQKTHFSVWGTLHSLLQNPLTKKVKVKFEPGSWSDGSAATKAGSWAGSSNVDGGDEIRPSWSSAVDVLRRRWRWGVQGFGFLLRE